MPRSVISGYRHQPRRVRFAGLRRVGDLRLKQYHITPPDSETHPWLLDLVEHWLHHEASKMPCRGDRGFLLIHQYSAEIHFLLPCLWCNANALCQAVWVHDGEMPHFQPFVPPDSATDGALRPTFSMWEMAVVAHETAAWGRYLSSARNAAANQHWADDVLNGMI